MSEKCEERPPSLTGQFGDSDMERCSHAVDRIFGIILVVIFATALPSGLKTDTVLLQDGSSFHCNVIQRCPFGLLVEDNLGWRLIKESAVRDVYIGDVSGGETKTEESPAGSEVDDVFLSLLSTGGDNPAMWIENLEILQNEGDKRLIIASLLALLSPDAVVRDKGLKILTKRPDIRCCTAVARLPLSLPWELRRRAENTLSDWLAQPGQHEYMDAMTTLSRATTGEERKHHLRTIARADTRETTRHLLRELRRATDDYTLDIIHALGETSSPQVIEKLVYLLADEDEEVRRAASLALRKQPLQEIFDLLVECLESDNDLLIRGALKVLQCISKETLPASPEAWISWHLAQEEVQREERRALKKTLLSSRDLKERLRAIGKTGRASDRKEDAFLILKPLLQDDNPIVRRAVVMALGNLSVRSSMPVLIDLLDDPDAAVRNISLPVLQSVSDQDFGPARSEWMKWWKNQSK